MKRLLYLVLALFLLAGCGGGGNGDNETSPGAIKPDGGGGSTTAKLLDLEILTGDVSIPLGSKQELKAEGVYADESKKDLTQEVEWFAENPGVVEIIKSESGVFAKALAVGTSKVKATVNGFDFKPTIFVTVTDVELRSIDITPREALLPLDQTMTFRAAGTYTDGSVRDITSEVKWSSTDEKKARFETEPGRVTGVGTGMVQIVAEKDNIYGQADLTIIGPDPEYIEIFGPLHVPLGAEVQVRVIGIFADDVEYDVTENVEWYYSPEGIVEISSEGKLAAENLGKTKITAKYYLQESSDHLEDVVEIEVIEATLEHITLAPENLVLIPEHTQAIQAMGTYSDGSVINISQLVAWASSEPTVADISSTGLVTGKEVGETTISATYKDHKGESLIDVTAMEPAGLEIVSEKAELNVGESVQFRAECLFPDGSRMDVTHLASWSVLEEDVVFVEKLENRGIVTALGVGKTEIMAVWEDFDATTMIAVQ